MSNASKYRKKAVEYEQLKQFDRAVASYVRAIEENENASEEVDVALFNKVGDLTLRQGRVTEAVTYYERAVEHYVNNSLFDNAIALCNKILRNAPGRSNVYFTLGRICGRKGLRSDATRNFLEYATRMQHEGRVDEGMRALAEVADLMPELTEVGRLVSEHAARAGISLAPRRRLTPVREQAQSEAADATRSFGLSRDLVFLDIDYDTEKPVRGAPPVPEPAKVVREEAPAALTPEVVAPVAESLVAETPVAETPVAETPVAKTPVAETPVAETPVVPELVEATPIAPTFVELTAAANTPIATTPVESTPVESAPVESTPVEEISNGAVPVDATPTAAASIAETPSPLARSSQLDDLMIFDPNEPTVEEHEFAEDDAATVVDGASIIRPYADPSLPVASLNDLEPTEFAGTPAFNDEIRTAPAMSDLLVRGVTPRQPGDVQARPTPVILVRVPTVPNFPAIETPESVVPLNDLAPALSAQHVSEDVVTESNIDFATTPVENDTNVARDVLASTELQSQTQKAFGAIAEAPVSAESPSESENDFVSSEVLASAESRNQTENVFVSGEALAPAELQSVTDANSLPDAIANALTPVELVIAESAPPQATVIASTAHESTKDNATTNESETLEFIPIDAVSSAPDIAVDDDIVNFAEEEEFNQSLSTPPLEGFTADEEPPVEDGVTLAAAELESEPEPIEFADAGELPLLEVEVLPSLDFDAMLEQAHEEVAPVADLETEEFAPEGDDLVATRFARMLDEPAPELVDEFDAANELPPLIFPLLDEYGDAYADDVDDIQLLDDSDYTPAGGVDDIQFIDIDADIAFIPETDDALALESIEFVANDLDALFIDSDVPTAVAAAEATLVASSRSAELQTASDADPTNFVLRRRLAESLFEAGNRHAAINELVAALAGAELAGNLENAAEVADELVRVAVDDVVHHQKRLELAIRLGDQSRLRDAYLDLADTLVRRGEDLRARAVYARVLEIDPWDDRARSALGDSAPPAPPAPPAPAKSVAHGSDGGHVNLADWLRDDEPVSTRMRMQEPDITGDEQDDFNALLRHFKEGVARSLGDDDYDSHYDLGVAYKEMGLLDDAVGEFQMALRSRTNRLAAYEALGQCFLEQQSYKVAVTVLSRALHEPGIQDEQRVGVLYLLGFSCEVLQRFDEARGYFQRVYATDIHFRDVAQRLADLDRTMR